MAVMDKQAGALFLMAVAEGFNVYGALNSSPWTAENFGADPEKARSCRNYVKQATFFNLILGAGTSLMIDSWWPLIGIAALSAYMYFLYERALQKGAASGSEGWANA